MSSTNPFTGLPYTQRYKDLYKKRSTLPVWSYREKLLEILDKHQVSLFLIHYQGCYLKFLKKKQLGLRTKQKKANAKIWLKIS